MESPLTNAVADSCAAMQSLLAQQPAFDKIAAAGRRDFARGREDSVLRQRR